MKSKPAKPVRPRKAQIQELPETRLEDLIGCTGYRGPAKTLKEMEEAITEEAARRS